MSNRVQRVCLFIVFIYTSKYSFLWKYECCWKTTKNSWQQKSFFLAPCQKTIPEMGKCNKLNCTGHITSALPNYYKYAVSNKIICFSVWKYGVQLLPIPTLISNQPPQLPSLSQDKYHMTAITQTSSERQKAIHTWLKWMLNSFSTFLYQLGIQIKFGRSA